MPEQNKSRLTAVTAPLSTPPRQTDQGIKSVSGQCEPFDIGRPYKRQLPTDLVISMAMVYLPKDGTDWMPLLKEAHKRLADSWMIGDAADVPSKVALSAFESMGYQYMQVENGEWRGRLGCIAFKHWSMFREHGKVVYE